ncbi:hypothetical protein D7319_08415 [Streptomyces radicis]|uniref:Uncharacterized protein n=1 Tax=Streptomyces radicis TaxID=1750517 RepID=A0A3A9WCE1_9ACTN|nr:hypothetical protein D7319_08415 [Streptomyces radicis]RKN24708.1 hypothetical protein D7318_09590 [Streptomyces radicis]
MQTTPAAASTTISVRTTDSGPVGGTALFWGDDPGPGDGEILAACDKQNGDGKIAYAMAQWKVNGEWQFFDLIDEGASDYESGCTYADLPNIAEEKIVYVTACLKSGPNSAREYCGEDTARA